MPIHRWLVTMPVRLAAAFVLPDLDSFLRPIGVQRSGQRSSASA
jgi:hypothetical protein